MDNKQTDLARRIRHVTVGTGVDGRKTLTENQRNLLTILEDATVRFLRDEIRFLRNLKEVKGSKLTMMYLGECLDTHRIVDGTHTGYL